MSYFEEIAAFAPQCEQEKADQALMLDYIRAFPENILTRENRFAHLTASALVLNPSLSRALMVFHNIYGCWCWTGGHADGDGDLLAVALREAVEETGAERVRALSPKILTLDVLPVWPHVKRGQFVSGHQHLNVTYALVADEGGALAAKPDENSGAAWFDLGELPALTAPEPYMLNVYRRIICRARRL